MKLVGTLVAISIFLAVFIAGTLGIANVLHWIVPAIGLASSAVVGAIAMLSVSLAAIILGSTCQVVHSIGVLVELNRADFDEYQEADEDDYEDEDDDDDDHECTLCEDCGERHERSERDERDVAGILDKMIERGVLRADGPTSSGVPQRFKQWNRSPKR